MNDPMAFDPRIFRQDKRQGFTLVEVLVVMAILAILVAISVFGLGFAMRRSRNISREAAIQNIVVGLNEYYGDHEEFPVNFSGPASMASLISPVQDTVLSPYIESDFDAPANTLVYYNTDSEYFTVCVNQETRTAGEYSWVCDGPGISMGTGWPAREIGAGACTDCDGQSGSGTASFCTEWDGEDWVGPCT